MCDMWYQAVLFENVAPLGSTMTRSPSPRAISRKLSVFTLHVLRDLYGCQACMRNHLLVLHYPYLCHEKLDHSQLAR